jgi:archaellum component FlaG (FlaF/FlaG flagellin family)
MVKSAEPSSSADFEVGTQITYSFVITNTGNVTIADVAVDELGFTGTGPLATPVCGPGSTALIPGAQVVCSVDYVITQEDVDSGSITNEAIATGTPPSGTPPIDTTPSSVTLPQPQAPNLTIVKSADRTSVGAVGDLITYSFLVTNTGNVTVHSPSVVETAFSGAAATPVVDCPVEVVRLLPGQSMVCEAGYEVVLSDLTGSPLRNSAVAAGSTDAVGDLRSLVSSVALPTLDLRSDSLATTGFDATPAVVVAGLLLAGGVLVLWIVRRRPRHDVPSP